MVQLFDTTAVLSTEDYSVIATDFARLGKPTANMTIIGMQCNRLHLHVSPFIRCSRCRQVDGILHVDHIAMAGVRTREAGRLHLFRRGFDVLTSEILSIEEKNVTCNNKSAPSEIRFLQSTYYWRLYLHAEAVNCLAFPHLAH